MSWPVNARTSAMMDEAQTLYGATITATKGSPVPGGGASAFTHTGEGAIDVDGDDLDAIVSAMRQVGFAAWHRTSAEGFAPHVHGVAVGEPDLHPEAQDQVDDYIAGRNGLATNAPDDGPREWVGQTWENYLAGAGAPAEGSPVFRGVQAAINDTSILAGTLDVFDVYAALLTRADGITVTVTAGDSFYVAVEPFATAAGDVYSMANWRLNASGAGVLSLGDALDPYDFTEPASWNDLGTATVTNGTLALTATLASTLAVDAGNLNGDNGRLLLKVTCLSGTIVLDWLCLQVEPPAGLLISEESVWSPWITPELVLHAPAGMHQLVVQGTGNVLGNGWDQDAATDAIQDAKDAAASDLAAQTWTVDYVPVVEFAAEVTAFARVEASATAGVFPGGFDRSATVELTAYFTAVQWGTWPDYRPDPEELLALANAGEVERDPVFNAPIYEFAAGDTDSVGWVDPELTGPLSGGYSEDNPSSVSDGVSGYVGRGSGLSGMGHPTGDPMDTYDQTPVYRPMGFSAPPGGDLLVVASSGYLDGNAIQPPSTGWAGGGLDPVTVAVRTFGAAGFFAPNGYVMISLQMPDFRYSRKIWIRSPDALDTSDPEGVVTVTWLRQRQRDDGLGNSVIRARGGSSRQTSLRQRGYR